MQYSTESTDAPFISGLLFPPSQLPDAPSPESFDQEFAELELCLPFDSEQSDGLFTTFRDFRPIISTPSVSTSTICVYGATPSTYSPDITRSGYFIPSELDEGYLSLNNGPYGTHDSIHSAVFSNGPPSIPPPHPAQAQFEFGTSDLSPNLIGISPEYLSAGIQSSPALSVHVTPDLEAQPLPIPNRPFKCPHSPHSSNQKHNPKTHIRTHNKSKSFKCSTCGRRFNRKNDLHCQEKSNHRSKAGLRL